MTIDLVNYKIVVEFQILVDRVLNHGQQENSRWSNRIYHLKWNHETDFDDLDLCHVGFWILVTVMGRLSSFPSEI